MGSMSDAQVQMLAHLACSSRPPGARKWDEPGVVVPIRKLLERGFGIREVIDRVLAHAWDATANTPGTILTPKSRQPVESNPTPYPVTRAVECRKHPGEDPVLCRPCAIDERIGDSTPVPPRKEDPPAFDPVTGDRLKHRPLRELKAEFDAELAGTTDNAEEATE